MTIHIANVRNCAAVASIAALAVIALQAHAGPDKIAFPDNYASGVLYVTLDNADTKQVREFYTSRAAVDCCHGCSA